MNIQATQCGIGIVSKNEAIELGFSGSNAKGIWSSLGLEAVPTIRDI